MVVHVCIHKIGYILHVHIFGTIFYMLGSRERERPDAPLNEGIDAGIMFTCHGHSSTKACGTHHLQNMEKIIIIIKLNAVYL